MSVYKYLLVAVALLTALPAVYADPDDGGKKEFTKRLKQSYATSPRADVMLANRHGKIDVITWDKAEVKIDVTITVKAKTEAIAQKVFDRITVEFDKKGNTVSAATVIQHRKDNDNTWWNGSSKGQHSQDYTIDYRVMMPSTNNLDVYNKYGDVVIPDLRGDLKASIKYGNITGSDVKGETDLTLGHGKARFANLQNVSGDVRYGHLTFDQALTVDLKSKHSVYRFERAKEIFADTKYDEFHVAAVSTLHSKGKYDEFHLGVVDKLTAQSQYSTYEVARLADDLDMNLRYGHFRVAEVVPTLASFDFEGDYTQVVLGMSESASFDLDAEITYGDMDAPRALRPTQAKQVGFSTNTYKGRMGKGNHDGKMKVRMKYGSLKIKDKKS